jgi:phosphate transport system protein
MGELQNRLERLILRLDRMGMRVEQAVVDALQALRHCDVQAGQLVDEDDSLIDREEVEIERECVRLLALYQPAAIDLRAICTVIKVNNDLERIADLAASIARRIKHAAEEELDVQKDYPDFMALANDTLDNLSRTVNMLNATDHKSAANIIQFDRVINERYRDFVTSVLETEQRRVGGTGVAMTLINLAKALERIGDLCTNIAEDIIFQRTGDFVRHGPVSRNRQEA